MRELGRISYWNFVCASGPGSRNLKGELMADPAKDEAKFMPSNYRTVPTGCRILSLRCHLLVPSIHSGFFVGIAESWAVGIVKNAMRRRFYVTKRGAIFEFIFLIVGGIARRRAGSARFSNLCR